MHDISKEPSVLSCQMPRPPAGQDSGPCNVDRLAGAGWERRPTLYQAVLIESPAFILYINSSNYLPEFWGRSGFDGRAETRVACTGCRWPV